MDSRYDFRVLIVGGGTSGLALAHGLQQGSIRYTLFERDPEEVYWNKSRDWGMQLHWGKEYLFSVIPNHIQSRLREALVDPHYDAYGPFPHINGNTGEVIAEVHMPGIVRVSREKLRKLLGWETELNMMFEKKLVSIAHGEDGLITASFSDGSEETGNLLVGCDGSRSKVREHLVGEELGKPTDIGMTMINHAAGGYTAEQALLLRKYHPIGKIAYHPDYYGNFLLAALDCSNRENPEEWKFQIQHAWWGPPYVDDLKDQKTRLEFYKTRCSKMCEPFRTAGVALPKNEILPIDPSQQWAPIEWDNRHGAVTLAGDAAHSMLPHRGQGLNNAMQDVAELFRAIKQVVSGQLSLETAITSYETAMRPRGAKDVELSLESAKKMHLSHLKESPFLKIGFHKQDTWGEIIKEN
ncbi:monooxygenase, putative [Talaromyces stipitatus ATCC 10500]|uniref:Monooxygenase, putative n=1 Tax=Talaromyces stipitatus (strain ATCC 10500 / CBS 375.48 / QM 6759 / NRRL 1006) TaxID=441959 RepID=B8MIZ8_TALSN|nr:monooxygenase, putative [Talaromyces stipitatus ATCC 10500]EED15660.1 monooxygenase, putative [Talaromyces stipitatus ATCC 10500]